MAVQNFYDPASNYGASGIRYSASSFLVHAVGTSVWQRQAVPEDRSGFMDIGQLAGELRIVGTFGTTG